MESHHIVFLNHGIMLNLYTTTVTEKSFVSVNHQLQFVLLRKKKLFCFYYFKHKHKFFNSFVKITKQLQLEREMEYYFVLRFTNIISPLRVYEQFYDKVTYNISRGKKPSFQDFFCRN